MADRVAAGFTPAGFKPVGFKTGAPLPPELLHRRSAPEELPFQLSSELAELSCGTARILRKSSWIDIVSSTISTGKPTGGASSTSAGTAQNVPLFGS